MSDSCLRGFDLTGYYYSTTIIVQRLEIFNLFSFDYWKRVFGLSKLTRLRVT